MYRVSLLSCHWILRLSRVVSANSGFLCDKETVSRTRKKGHSVSNTYKICSPSRKMCKFIPVRAMTLGISGYMLPCIHILGTKWKWVVRLATQPLYPRTTPQYTCRYPAAIPPDNTPVHLSPFEPAGYSIRYAHCAVLSLTLSGNGNVKRCWEIWGSHGSNCAE